MVKEMLKELNSKELMNLVLEKLSNFKEFSNKEKIYSNLERKSYLFFEEHLDYYDWAKSEVSDSIFITDEYDNLYEIVKELNKELSDPWLRLYSENDEVGDFIFDNNLEENMANYKHDNSEVLEILFNYNETEIINVLNKILKTFPNAKLEYGQAEDAFEYETIINKKNDDYFISSKFILDTKDLEFFFTQLINIFNRYSDLSYEEFLKIDITFILNVDEFNNHSKPIYIETGKSFMDSVLIENNHFFDERGRVIEYIRKYPVIMDKAPDDIWNDKEIVMEFLQANNRILGDINEYESDYRKTRILTLNAVTSIFDSNIHERLEKWLNDNDVFNFLVESHMSNYITSRHIKNMSEKDVLVAVKKNKYLIYDYYFTLLKEEDYDELWIRDYLKTFNILREKLDDDELFNWTLYYSTQGELEEAVGEYVKQMTREEQEKLIYSYPYMIKYIKNTLDPFDKLVDFVINNYSKATFVLSDETILVRRLK